MKTLDRFMNRAVISTLIRRGNRALKKLDENSREAARVNRELLFRILRDNQDTEYGKKYHFDEIRTIEDFKEKVPFSEYDHYAPYIERMIKKNEQDLITVYPVVHYAVSSGSIGVPKHIPVSKQALEHYNFNAIPGVFAACNNYWRKHFGKNFPVGRGLNTIEVALQKTENGVTQGAISGAAVDRARSLLPYFLTSPNEVIFPEGQMDMKYLKTRYALADRDMVFMDSAFMTGLVDLMNYIVHNWELLTDDIASGRISPEISLPDTVRENLEKRLKPDPKRAEELRREFEKGFDTPIIPRIWKKMSWIAAIGTGGFTTYTEKMRSFAGDSIPIEFMAYAASESLMAICRYAEKMEYVLLPDSAFYEFIPMDQEDGEERTLTLEELEVGKEYEVVLTNLSGFYRYRLKDVIRVTGYHGQSPKICFVYRKNQMLSIAGEKTNDQSVQWAVQQTGRAVGYDFVDYCVYADTDTDPGHYEVLLEPTRMVNMADLPRIRETLDQKLGEANPSYGAKVKTGVLGKMGVHISQIETHALYRDLRIAAGTSPNQLKPVRVLDTPMKVKFFFGLTEEE